MALPAILAGIGTGIGALGSLFGTGSKTEIPPELREIYNLLMQQSQEGLSDRTVDMLLRRAKTGLGNEAGALGAMTEARLTRQGAGTGVKQSALSRINEQRLRGIGDVTTQVGLADEEAKQAALRQLAQLAPMFGDPNFKSQYGQGFADLLQGGLSYLLNQPGKQPAAAPNPILDAVNEFLYPSTQNPIQVQQPNVNPTPYLLQFGGGK
jgi:hypothetical protein